MFATLFNWFLVLLGAVSSVVTIISACLKDRIKLKWKIISASVLFIFTVCLIYQNYTIREQASVISRRENIARNARTVLKEAERLSAYESVEAYLTFIESASDVFPDAYRRASMIEAEMDNDGYIYLSTDSTVSADVTSKKLRGIVNSISMTQQVD